MAVSGLEIRAVESNQMARFLAGAIITAQPDVGLQRCLARVLAALSYGTFAAPDNASSEALVLWLVSSVTYSCPPSGDSFVPVLLVLGEFDKEFVQVRPGELPLKRPGDRFVVRLEVQ